MGGIRAQVEALGLGLSPRQESQLEGYQALLEHWDRTINLTALRGKELIRRLIAEPFWVAAQLRPEGRYLDIGSGNGSPSIPWHIARRFVSTELVESRGRRTVFLETAIQRLGLDRMSVHATRLEDFSPRGQFDWISLQGIRLTRPLLKSLTPHAGANAQLVWFTKRAKYAELRPSRVLEIPDLDRCVLIFPVHGRTSSDAQ